MPSKILLNISASIAAYKTPDLIRSLQKQGFEIQCIASKNALKFITPTVIQSISKNPLRHDLFEDETEIGHINLARQTKVFLIAPATAAIMAKLANGIADDLLSTLYLALDESIPVILAPAMNSKMWLHPATQKNIEILKKRPNHFFIEPEIGELACGENAIGKMASIEKITDFVCQVNKKNKNLHGLKILITNGATRENIDPVRFLSNRSSGKMGFAFAKAAIEQGAEVKVISGYCEVPPPENCQIIKVESALQMYETVLKHCENIDLFIATAAVTDYRVKEVFAEKFKKSNGKNLQIELIENPDILATVAKLPQKQRPKCVVGFAAETNNLEEYALNKLEKKNLDFICANNISQFPFGSNQNQILLLAKNIKKQIPAAEKSNIAKELLAIFANYLKNKKTQN